MGPPIIMMWFMLVDITPPVLTLLGAERIYGEAFFGTYNEPGFVAMDTFEGDITSQVLIDAAIDYAVLERARNVVVIEAPFQWDDVGSWLSLPRLNGCDADGNTIDGPFCGVDTHGCIIRTTDDHLIATLGLRNVIIVHTGDATLVADAAQSERIKEILSQLEKQDRQAYL